MRQRPCRRECGRTSFIRQRPCRRESGRTSFMRQRPCRRGLGSRWQGAAMSVVATTTRVCRLLIVRAWAASHGTVHQNPSRILAHCALALFRPSRALRALLSSRERRPCALTRSRPPRWSVGTRAQGAADDCGGKQRRMTAADDCGGKLRRKTAAENCGGTQRRHTAAAHSGGTKRRDETRRDPEISRHFSRAGGSLRVELDLLHPRRAV